MVTCNLNSINLGKIDEDFLEEQIALQVRMLDNVITINQTPVPESRLTCDKYRAIGLGTSGYHHYLVKHGLRWESKEHIAAADALLKRLPTMPSKRPWNFPKGLILPSKGSEWDTGKYFTRRGYTSEKWQRLAADVHKYGMRNGYLLAVAPTGSTSNIANTTAGIDPIFKKFFIEEKQGSFLPRKRHRTLTQRHSGSIRKLIPLTSSGPFVPMQPVSATSIRPNPLIFISRPA